MTQNRPELPPNPSIPFDDFAIHRYRKSMVFQSVSAEVEFAQEEEKVLGFWHTHEIFLKSVSSRPENKSFLFYDGPPFATGLPHYGHLVASTIKDIVPRYWTMKGFRVERRWGWDCHGLPIEQEIDKKHQFKSAKEVEAFGIANYNQECRDIVLRFTEEWQKTINRLGRWADFQNDYKTMDRSFMESVWWVLGELWRKNLVYRSYRVMPFSTPLGTPLSNFEAGSNYQDVQDPAITIKFTSQFNPNKHFLVWTTTPWTLPTNLALAMGSEITYVELHSKKDNQHYILAENRVKTYFPKIDEYEIKRKFTGKEFVGSYSTTTPLDPTAPQGSEIENLYTSLDLLEDKSLFENQKGKAFRIILSNHVTDSDGTGIVHMAPAHGQEDLDACRGAGIDPICVVDEAGIFTENAKPYAGQFVKTADKEIIADLKKNQRLFKQDTLQHAYPFCPRTDTPLISRIVASWFVKVDAIKEQMLAANRETRWVPENLRDGRFGNWLEGARDWSISRNRYWGNPLPFWEAFEEPEDKREYICLSDVAELEQLTGKKLPDLHREHFDGVIITKNGKKFRRVPEVLDCWFESGAMPYAQNHYPFENKEKFDKSFPADFIAEGLDQTRGWFYTLTVLGTALFGKSPFKNVIVNGLILAEDGKKMSKRLKNYPDPKHVIDQYGADALRLYLISSPAVRAEELRFSEAGVKDVVRRVLLKWWNAYSFFCNYAAIDKWEFTPNAVEGPSSNLLDRWILSRLQSLLASTETEMAAYRLYTVVPALLDFIEDLTNTYIRFNRKRFWDEGDTADKRAAYSTLYQVLRGLSLAIAPFAPFLAETTFQALRLPNDPLSVHLADYPLPQKNLIDTKLEEAVTLMNRVILLARNVREKENIKVKIPLKTLTIVHQRQDVHERLRSLEGYIRDELNVKNIVYRTDDDTYVTLTAKGSGFTLGKKLGAKFAAVNKAVMSWDFATISQVEQGGSADAAGEKLTRDDVLIYRQTKPGFPNAQSDAFVTIDLDTSLDASQIAEGRAREVVGHVQKLRKSAGLNLSDRIAVEYQAECDLAAAIAEHSAYVCEQTLALKLAPADLPKGDAESVCEVDGLKLHVALTKTS